MLIGRRGIVFKAAPPSGGTARTETVLHNWPCANAGGSNESRVVYYNGLLYGTTTFLGNANLGQVSPWRRTVRQQAILNPSSEDTVRTEVSIAKIVHGRWSEIRCGGRWK